MIVKTVYIIICADGRPYVGCTSNLGKRIKAHQKGEVHFTKSRLPVKLKTAIGFADKITAYNFERYLKSGSGIAFMKKRLL